MDSEAAPKLKTIALPLVIRAVLTGALLGAFISAGASAFSTLQASLYPDQFGLWGMNGGQILFMTMLGLVIGSVAGVATGAGSVLALWVKTNTSSAVALPGTLTAGLGAAAVTGVYIVIAFHVLGVTGVALAGFGAGFAIVAGVLAALGTRRLIRRGRSVDPKHAR